MKKLLFAFAAFYLLAFTSCNSAPDRSSNTNDSTSVKDSTKSRVMIPDKAGFQDNVDGKKTDLFILKNHNGMTAAITNYGGRLVSLLVPDKNGKFTDVVVGFKTIKEYES